MKNITWIILGAILLAACSSAETPVLSTPEIVTDQPAPAQPETLPKSPDVSVVDILANLPEVNCESGLTPPNPAGPYFKEGSPETNVLYFEETEGVRLILVGQVFNLDCFPFPNVKIDFWQTDANGDYDNAGYSFRGHQFTDNKGRYHLDTVLPGLYSSRPIEHIHVTLTSPSGGELTTQLYFPDQPGDNLTVQLEDRGDYFVGYFNFIVQ
jgi:protocatechuate 3,4-dioxygenase beta subunit